MTLTEKVASLFSSAAEVRQIANLSHSIPGTVFIIVVILMLVAGFGYRTRVLTYTYSLLLLIFSTVFTGYIFLMKGLQNLPRMVEVVMAYPEISVHLIQSAAAIIGGLVEFLYAKKVLKNKLFELVFPAIFIVIGYTNILHPHGPIHDENHASFHALLGSIMVLSGIFLIISRLTKQRTAKVFLVLGVITVVGFCGMLIMYKESPEAYEYAFPTKKAPLANDFIDMGTMGTIYLYKDHVTPQHIQIKKGGKVLFVEVDDSVHDFASGPHPAHTEYPPLNIGYLKKGEAATVDFPAPGLHGFHDHVNDDNENLMGEILVVN
jgi:hypothetical protein